MIVINEQNLHNHHPDQKEDQNHYQQVVAGILEGSDPPHHHYDQYDQYEARISRVLMIRTCMKRIRGLNVQAEADQEVLKPVTSPGADPRSTPQADLKR